MSTQFGLVKYKDIIYLNCVTDESGTKFKISGEHRSLNRHPDLLKNATVKNANNSLKLIQSRVYWVFIPRWLFYLTGSLWVGVYDFYSESNVISTSSLSCVFCLIKQENKTFTRLLFIIYDLNYLATDWLMNH